MGGNLFKDLNTVRVDQVQYHQIYNDLEKSLLNPINKIHDLIPSYRSKPSFGDMDIIISSYDSEDYDRIRHQFPIHHKNGKILSFAYPLENHEYFQIDLIQEPLYHYDFSLNYYSYNDLGNFIGRLARYLGFKFGHDGLHYLHREDNGNLIESIEITTNFYDAITFLGFDVTSYNDSFNTLDDIFEFVIFNPYFDPEAFDLEKMGHRSRVRDKKRENYRLFIEKIKDMPYGIKNKDELRQIMFEEALKHYPSFASKLKESQERYTRNKIIREKFNGELIMKTTGLEGKELGAFMRAYKEGKGDEFERLILNKDIDFIITDLTHFHQEHTK